MNEEELKELQKKLFDEVIKELPREYHQKICNNPETEKFQLFTDSNYQLKFCLDKNKSHRSPAVDFGLYQGSTATIRAKRCPNNQDTEHVYLCLAYFLEYTQNKQSCIKRFLYHKLNDTPCKSLVKSPLSLSSQKHIQRWQTKYNICLNIKNATQEISPEIISECANALNDMMFSLEEAYSEYRKLRDNAQDTDTEIIDSIISELNKSKLIKEKKSDDVLLTMGIDILGEEYKNKYNSFKKLFLELDDIPTNDSEGAREELLKEIHRQITGLNNEQQENIMTNREIVDKLMSILFPDNRFIAYTKELGPEFLRTLLENKTYSNINILSTEPIYDQTGKKSCRTYSSPYKIEGIDYYISSQWTWDGSPNVKACKVIPKICEHPYITETAKQQLQELAEEWSHSVQKTPQKESTQTSRNLIYFGAPGTGKSYLLNEKAKDFEGSQSGTTVTECGLTEYVERVTFHTEYTYFDFVGSYKPMMEGQNIKYAFEPGPFARVLKKALSNPEKEYLLIIEEINRARVAAVFGDMFQLLDRNKNGQSEYFITPAKDLLAYLTTEEKDEAGNIIQQRAELAGGKLRLPSNMFIWATMNSADQGVFPMDTAFKRRWSFKYVGIDESEKNIKGNCADEWKELRKRINQLLQEAGINEDKQLGPFFLKASELEDEETFLKAFSEKVIMYLFEDAARHHRSHIFTQDNPRYSTLTDAFKRSQGSIFNTPKQQDSNTQESGSENT